MATIIITITKWEMMWYEKKNSAYDGDSDDCDSDTDDYDENENISKYDDF
jgi:hypothetical protein